MGAFVIKPLNLTQVDTMKIKNDPQCPVNVSEILINEFPRPYHFDSPIPGDLQYMLIAAYDHVALTGDRTSKELVIIGVIANRLREHLILNPCGLPREKVKDRVRIHLRKLVRQYFPDTPILFEYLRRNNDLKLMSTPRFQNLMWRPREENTRNKKHSYPAQSSFPAPNSVKRCGDVRPFHSGPFGLFTSS